jgi:hypothetical protein
MVPKLEEQIRDLDVSDPASLERGAAAVSESVESARHARTRRLQLFGVAGVVAITFLTASTPGRDVASAAGDLVGISSGPSPSQEELQQAAPYEAQREAADKLLLELREKAANDELQADFDQAEAVQLIDQWFERAAGLEVSDDWEDRMTLLLDELRESGEFPPIGTPEEEYADYGS